MAEERCPNCDRIFRRIADFPRVLIREFQRGVISDKKLPINYHDILVGPSHGFHGPMPPEEVLAYFKQHPEERKFEFDGWRWRKMNPDRTPPTQVSWDTAMYMRSQEDGRKLILSYVSPILDRLERLVGQEVPVKEILPDFSEGVFYPSLKVPSTQYGISLDEFYFNIPNTQYGISLDELEGLHETWWKQYGLEIPKLKLQSPRTLILNIISLDEGSALHAIPHAILASVGYEGRLYLDHR